jgi:steroid 5-alpha reductase family enzyme
MNQNEVRQLLGLPVVLVIAAGLAWAGSHGATQAFGLPLYALEIIVIFVIQWLAFIPSWVLKTEKFYDLTGSITYLTVTISALRLSGALDLRAWLVAGMVIIWAVRLGSFLFIRVIKRGKDARFDELKTSFPRFLMTWTLQGLWVSFTMAAALVVLASQDQVPVDVYAIVGTLVWILGFGIEVISDWQKNRFRADPSNKGRFIQNGLWAWSRHPNYFGEILLWIGVAIIALPVMRGWQLAGLISPLFVFFLITRVSGISILEKRADEKWGDMQDYEKYKSSTPVLLPFPPKIKK